MLSVSQVHLYGVDEAGGEQLCALATLRLGDQFAIVAAFLEEP
jgi:hypothetical protein